MTTPNCVDKILQRLKDGLLVNLDKHSLENVRTILEEETKSAPKIAGLSLRAKTGRNLWMCSRMRFQRREGRDIWQWAVRTILTTRKRSKRQQAAKAFRGTKPRHPPRQNQ